MTMLGSRTWRYGGDVLVWVQIYEPSYGDTGSEVSIAKQE